MNPFFQKKLFLLDVDHTLIDWSSPKTWWHFRQDIPSKFAFGSASPHQRGRRVHSQCMPQYSSAISNSQYIFGNSVRELLSILRTSGCGIGIFSDLPQSALHSTFEKMGIHHIVCGLTIGALKPLPDGCLQLMTAFGVVGSQVYLIGDGVRTDARAITSIGGTFIAIDSLLSNPQALHRWLR